jgi:hypothetical protein
VIYKITPVTQAESEEEEKGHAKWILAQIHRSFSSLLLPMPILLITCTGTWSYLPVGRVPLESGYERYSSNFLNIISTQYWISIQKIMFM